jgi:hypothetical protein
MKREWSHYRGTALPALFVRPSTDDQLNLARTFSLPGQRRGRARKIFIIKKTSRFRSTDGADKKIRRILIFDNHPESLRLVYGCSSNPDVDLSAPQRVSSWELIIVYLVTFVGLIGMFWPIL